MLINAKNMLLKILYHVSKYAFKVYRRALNEWKKMLKHAKLINSKLYYLIENDMNRTHFLSDFK